MNYEDLLTILNQATQSSNKQLQLAQSQYIEQIIQENPQNFLQCANEIIQQQHPASLKIIAILKHQLAHKGDQSVVILNQSEDLVINLHYNILNYLIKNPIPVVSILAGYIAQYSQNSQLMDNTLSFVKQAITQNKLLQRCAVQLLYELCAAPPIFLNHYIPFIIELLTQYLQLQELSVLKFVFQGINSLMTSTNDQQEDIIPDEGKIELVKMMIGKISQISIKNELNEFIQCLEAFRETTEMFLESTLECDVLLLLDALMQSDELQIKEMGLEFLTTICSVDYVDLNLEQLRILQQIVVSYIFPIILNIDEQYINQIFSHNDFSDVDDDNDYYVRCKQSLYGFANRYFDALFDIYEQFCQNSEENLQLSHFKILMLDTMFIEIPINYSKIDIIQKFFEEGNLDSDLIMFRIIFALKNQITKCGDNIECFKIGQTILAQTQQWLDNIHNSLITAAYISLLCSITENSIEFTIENKQFIKQVLYSFYEVDNFVIQRTVVFLTQNYLKSLKNDDVNDIIVYNTQTFFNIIPNISEKISVTDQRYLQQLIQLIGDAMCILPNLFNEHSQAIIQIFIDWILNPDFENLACVYDSVVLVICGISSKYSLSLNYRLNELLTKFIEILDVGYIHHDESTSAQEIANRNILIKRQQDVVLKCLGSLIVSFPHILELGNKINEMLTNKNTYYQFENANGIYCRLLSSSMLSNTMVEETFGLVFNYFEKQITNRQYDKNSDEIQSMLENILIVVQSYAECKQRGVNYNEILDFCIQHVGEALQMSYNRLSLTIQASQTYPMAKADGIIDDGWLAVYKHADIFSGIADVLLQAATGDKELQAHVLTSLVECAKLARVESFVCACIKQLLKYKKQDSSPFFEKFFVTYFTFYVKADRKQVPVAQALINVIIYFFDNPIIKSSMEQFQTLFEQLQQKFDSQQFALLFVMVVIFNADSEIYGYFVDQLLTLQMKESFFVMFDMLMNVLLNQKYPEFTQKTLISAINLLFENPFLQTTENGEKLLKMIPDDIELQLLRPTARNALKK